MREEKLKTALDVVSRWCNWMPVSRIYCKTFGSGPWRYELAVDISDVMLATGARSKRASPIRYWWPWSFSVVHEVVQRLWRINLRQTSRQNTQGKTPADRSIIEQGDCKRMPFWRTVTNGEMHAEPAWGTRGRFEGAESRKYLGWRPKLSTGQTGRCVSFFSVRLCPFTRAILSREFYRCYLRFELCPAAWKHQVGRIMAIHIVIAIFGLLVTRRGNLYNFGSCF